MSGGGGSSGSGGRSGAGGFVPPSPTGPTGRKPGSSDPCELLITLPLSAVQPENLKKIKIRDTLQVSTRESKGVTTVIVLAPDNSIVGAVAYRDVETLIECIDEGNNYIARVIELGPSSVKAQISRS